MVSVRARWAAIAGTRNAGPSIRVSMLATGAIRGIALPFSALASVTSAGLVVRDVGTARYGIVTLVTMLVTMLPFADLGLSAALTTKVARDGGAAVLHLRTAWWLMCVTIAVTLGVCAWLEATVGWKHLLGIEGSYPASWQVLAAIVCLLISVPIGMGQRILVGLGKVSRVTVIQSAIPFLSLGMVTCAHLSKHYGTYVMIPAVAQLAVSIALFIYGLRTFRKFYGIKIGIIAPTFGSAQVRRDLVAAGLPMMLISTGLALALQTDRLVLSHVSTDDQLGEYAIGMTMYAPAWALVTTIGTHLWPHFASQRGRGGALDFWARWRDIQMISIVLFLCFVGVAPAITSLWAGRSINFLVWLFLGLLLLVQSAHLPTGMFLTDVRGLRFQAGCITAMCLVNFGLSLYLAPVWGARGPIAASIATIFTFQLLPGLASVGRRMSTASLERHPEHWL